jgi:hypothetical protein
VQQERDPFGGDAGVENTAQIPDAGPVLNYGSSYSASGNVSYTVDGIRVSLDDFILRLGHLAHDPMGLLEMSRDPAPRSSRRSEPPQLVPFNDPRHPYRPFDQDIEQPLGAPGIDNLNRFLSLIPQNSGFLYGRSGFNQSELGRLAKAFERVDGENCHKFFDDTLANMRKRGEIAPRSRFTPSTLQGVLNITTLNKYSASLTARQVGVSQSSWGAIQSTFANPQDGKYASAVTLADGRVFLGDNAFYIAGPVEGFFGANSADLSGIIVHEFFHRAGLSEAQIKALHPQIQQNCGIRGFAL